MPLLTELNSSGGWLVARLIGETRETAQETQTQATPATPVAVDLGTLVHARFDDALRRASDPDAAVGLTSLLVVAGVGPVLPLPLAATALRVLGHEQSVADIRDIVVELGVLVSRGKPGLPEETLGIAHTEFIGSLETAVDEHTENMSVAAHTAIVSALSELESVGAAAPDITAYARNAAPRHHLAASDAAGALATLVEMDTHRAADNRDRWASWLPEFEQQLGADDPDTLTIRSNLAFWRGEVRLLARARGGDVAGAVAAFEALLTERLRVLGADHPDTLTTRSNLASCRGEGGDVAGAVAAFEALLTEQLRVLGADHPDTLTTRNNLAFWRGEGGDAGEDSSL